MRPVLHGDISAAARVLLRVCPQAREDLSRRMISEAEIADRHVLATGQLHPRFGNGSLMMAAFRHLPADEPNFDDTEYCRCVQTILRHLIVFHANRTRS